MDDKAIVEARRRAEKAVEGMSDPDLKVKAFEQVFAKLLENATGRADAPPGDRRRQTPKSAQNSKGADGGTLTERLLALKADGFFDEQRSLSEVQEELRSRGWHYPVTTLSGIMQRFVRTRELRRERAKVGNKKIWKYANA